MCFCPCPLFAERWSRHHLHFLVFLILLVWMLGMRMGWCLGMGRAWAESWSDGGGPRPWISDQHHRILGSHGSLIIWGIVYSLSIIKTNHRRAACSRPVVITQQLLSPHFPATHSLSRSRFVFSLLWLLIRPTFFLSSFSLLIHCTFIEN